MHPILRLLFVAVLVQMAVLAPFLVGIRSARAPPPRRRPS
jgi:hypothetical protein